MQDTSVMTGASSRRALAIAAFVLAFLALVLGTTLLPYWLPSGEVFAGTSSELGFNNSVAYGWYVAFLIVPGFLLARLLPRALPAMPRASGLRAAFPWRLWSALAAAHVVLFAALFAYKGRFVFSEGLYFQSLMHRIDMGERPYLDFSYSYGPSMLYPAHWLAGVFGLEAGYGLWFVLTYVAGLGLLAVLLGTLVRDRAVTGVWLVVVAVALFNPTTGLNVTMTRYLLPSAVYFVTVSLVGRADPGRWLAATALIAFALLYSFEVALLTIFAVLAVVALHVARSPLDAGWEWLQARWLHLTPAPSAPSLRLDGSAAVMPLGALAVGAVVAVAVLLALDPSARGLRIYPQTAFAFLAGAHNEPIYPHLAFLALAAISVFAVAGTFCALPAAVAPPLRPVMFGYLGLALLTERASFSMAEPEHISAFGLPALLLALGLTTRLAHGSAIRGWLLAAVLAGFAIPLQAYLASQFFPFLRPASAAPVAAPGEATPARSQALEAGLVDAVLSVGTDRPYLMYALTYYSVPVYHRLGLRYANYDTDFNSARTPQLIDDMAREVRLRGAYVIVRQIDLDSSDATFTVDPMWDAFSIITGASMPGSRLYAQQHGNNARIRAPFIDDLRRHYHAIYQRDGILVLAPNGQ